MTRRVRRSVLVAAERDGRWSVRAEHRMVRRHVVVTDTWEEAMRLAPAMVAVVTLETPSSRDYTSPADQRRNRAMADDVLELMRASVSPRSRRRRGGVPGGPLQGLANLILGPPPGAVPIPSPWSMSMPSAAESAASLLRAMAGTSSYAEGIR